MSVETNAAEDPGSEAYIDMSDKAAVERFTRAGGVVAAPAEQDGLHVVVDADGGEPCTGRQVAR